MSDKLIKAVLAWYDAGLALTKASANEKLDANRLYTEKQMVVYRLCQEIRNTEEKLNAV